MRSHGIFGCVRARFAPSPTGDLHLGGAFTALAAWWLARRQGGETVLRVEDLDRPRVVAGAEARQLEDLTWLGLDWDEGPPATTPLGPYRQSERTGVYDEALAKLEAQGRTYPCDCSRAEIARVASAPHEGEEVAYPGACRDKDPARSMRRAPAVRLRVEAGDVIRWVDGVRGAMDVERVCASGDFVLRRGDGVHSYQLAVSVDDAAMRISDVVRGDDLVTSTPRQLLLMRLLAGKDSTTPRYWHLPLVRDARGDRLAKRVPGTTVRDLREAGVPASALVGHLAQGLGLRPSTSPCTAAALVRDVPPAVSFRKDAWSLPLFRPSASP